MRGACYQHSEFVVLQCTASMMTRTGLRVTRWSILKPSCDSCHLDLDTTGGWALAML
uniref:Uncharacterized protein n=1 Tax=Amphimedon queenslandica TaxID=400682 RepID=A0A1X7V0F9_AMPQE